LIHTAPTFHDDNDSSLQTDGWFSEKSASVYETSTETLFLGRQDAMQRQSLVPLHSFMQARSSLGHSHGEHTSMLEVACGTGRFATFVKARFYVGSSEAPPQSQSCSQSLSLSLASVKFPHLI